MIPIIVITESNESFNYFQGRIRSVSLAGLTNTDWRYRIEHEITGVTGLLNGVDEIYERPFIVFETSDYQLRDKVLELLHKAVRGCFNFYGRVSELHDYEITYQTEFQIHLKDIIEKAKGELK
jgi:hypothetical protein